MNSDVSIDKTNIKGEPCKILKNVISYLIIWAPTLIYGFMGKTVEMGIALAMGGVIAIFINLDRFKSFKVANIEAQLREVKTIADEALLTVENIKPILKPLFLSTLNSVAYRNHPFISREKSIDAAICETKDILKKLGIDDSDISAMLCDYDRLKKLDAYALIGMAVEGTSIDPEKVSNLTQALAERKKQQIPNEKELLSLFDSNGINDSQVPKNVKMAIDNYIYVLENDRWLYETNEILDAAQ